MKCEDNISQFYFQGFDFNPPYKFLIYRYVKWDKTQNNVLYLVDFPASAYILVEEYKRTNKSPHLYDYCLLDSFGNDAYEFCKNQYDKIQKTVVT